MSLPQRYSLQRGIHCHEAPSCWQPRSTWGYATVQAGPSSPDPPLSSSLCSSWRSYLPSSLRSPVCANAQVVASQAPAPEGLQTQRGGLSPLFAPCVDFHHLLFTLGQSMSITRHGVHMQCMHATCSVTRKYQVQGCCRQLRFLIRLSFESQDICHVLPGPGPGLGPEDTPQGSPQVLWL